MSLIPSFNFLINKSSQEIQIENLNKWHRTNYNIS